MKPEIPLEDVPNKCPFCGGDKLTKHGSYYSADYWIECEKCRARGPIAHTLQAAIRKWNKEHATPR